MKTRLLLVTIIISGCVINSFGQVEQPGNAGFENWEAVGGSTAEDPVDWSSLNEYVSMGIPEFLFKTTDASSGSFAMKVTSDTASIPPPFGSGALDTAAGMVVLGDLDFDNSGVSYTDRPNEMILFTKGNVGAGDVCFVFAELSKWNTSTNERDLVGEAVYMMTTNISDYMQQTITFDYNSTDTPDTLSMMIAGGNVGPGGAMMPGNNFYVDDISFTTPVGVNNFNGEDMSVEIYPNPTSEEVNIRTARPGLHLEIRDVTGKLVKLVDELGTNTNINLQGLADGVYTYQLKTRLGANYHSGRLVIAN